MRKDSAAGEDDYVYTGLDDPRFVHDLVGIQSIATSTAQNDPGLFELNFRDERYLPFEGAGVISRWRLELPTKVRQFDYDTISDVVMHLSYTARDAGGTLKEGAEAAIGDGLNKILKTIAADDTGLVRVFSLRREFPDVFHRLLTNPSAAGEPLQILPEHFPFLLRSTRPALTFLEDGKIDLHAIVKAEVDPQGVLQGAQLGLAIAAPNDPPPTPTVHDVSVLNDPRVASLTVTTTEQGPSPGWVPQTWVLKQTNLHADTLDDLVIVARYTVDKAAFDS
jgi:hypothetical protein